MKNLSIKRMWINQPSTLQPLHCLHGKNVLAVDEDYSDKCYRVYFTEGKTVSMRVLKDCLSLGWK